MSQKLIISLFAIAILFFQLANGQEIDSTSLKQIEFFKKVTFGMGQELLKSRELQYKIKEDYLTPWDKLSKRSADNLRAGLDSIIANGTINIEKSHFSEANVVFKSKIEGIENLDDIFGIELIDHSLSDTNKSLLNVEKSARTNFGSISNSGIKNGEPFSHNYRTIKSFFEIESKKDTNGISGKVKLLASFPSSYDKVLITPKDIGKQFNLGTKKYQVVNVFKNIIILKPDLKNENLERDFKFVNLDSNGNEIGQISYTELMKMNKGKDVEMLGVGTQTISERIYKIFVENPDISQQEFDTIIDPIVMQIYNAKDKKAERNKQLGQKYIAITNAGPVENCYLYFEKREMKKEFEKEL